MVWRWVERSGIGFGVFRGGFLGLGFVWYFLRGKVVLDSFVIVGFLVVGMVLVFILRNGYFDMVLLVRDNDLCLKGKF